MDENTQIQTVEHNTALTAPPENHQGLSVIDSMREAYSLAKVLMQGKIIPENYQNNPSDCMVAIDMANRMNISPLVVMQNMYVVKGKPSWSGQACKMLIDNCGKFADVHHVYIGERGTDSRGCYLVGVRVSDGTIVEGAEVTIRMAKDEGWFGKNPKWRNMPELMLAYRASAFFARVHCPEALMGVHADDEVEDFASSQRKQVATANSDLTNMILEG